MESSRSPHRAAAMRSALTDDEADHVMANVFLEHRRWCDASCGPRPGAAIALHWACACTGCIAGRLTWEEFSAWQAREAQRDLTPFIDDAPSPQPLTLAQRLADYKHQKHTRGSKP
jgi:hypothetical protein